MKKKLHLLLCLCVAALSVKAQKADVAQQLVHYKFSHLRDTTKRDTLYKENMVLLVGKSASVYKSYDRKLQQALIKKQVAAQMAANGGGGGPIKITSNGRGITRTEIFLFPAESKMVRKENLINNYLIDEPMPSMSWKISGDTASFSGLHCQKATTHFKGRDYTAWFCPDLPYHSGPWKLCGLPGLIIEASDAHKEVVFKFDGMEDASKLEKPAAGAESGTNIASGGTMVRVIGFGDANEDPTAIALPADGIKATEKEYKGLQEAMIKDPNAFMQSAMAGSGAAFKMNNDQGPGPKTSMKIQMSGAPVVNNPIELPEKK